MTETLKLELKLEIAVETGTDSVTNPLAAALGSKLTYRPAADVQGPQIIYKEGGTPASTDFITKAIQGYGTTPASDERTYENETASNNLCRQHLCWR